MRYFKVIEYIYVTYVYENQYFSFELTAGVLVLFHDATAEAKCAMFSQVMAASSPNVIIATAFHMGQALMVSVVRIVFRPVIILFIIFSDIFIY